MTMPVSDEDLKSLDTYDRFSGNYADFFVTYTLYNWLTGKIYSGMARGYHSESPDDAMRRRYHEHVRLGKTLEEGWEPPVLDQISVSKSTIRGREQMLVEFYRSRGLAAPENRILPISPKNALLYIARALSVFGPIPEEGVHKPLPR